MPEKALPQERLSPPENIRLGRLGFDVSFPKYIWWDEVAGAEEYLIEVYDAHTKKKIFSKRVDEKLYKFPGGIGGFLKDYKPKYYFIRVAAVDETKVVGQFSPCGWTYTGDHPPGKKIETSSLAQCSNRTPASQFVSEAYLQRNKDYDKSQFQWEGASFLISTNELTNTSGDFATAMISTARGIYWLNHRHGFEGAIKSKVTGYNELSSQVSPLQYEARYHMRWKVPFFWKSLFREFQVSAFLGYESYKNNSSENTTFIKSYNLTKGGLAFRFPFFENWDGGGELVYGRSGDGSTKTEMQGYLNYYIKEKWSVGFGYRIHMVEAGSLATAPTGVLPFRESYGEAFGNLRYSF